MTIPAKRMYDTALADPRMAFGSFTIFPYTAEGYSFKQHNIFREHIFID